MSGTVKKRAEIDPLYKWALEDIYTDEKLWENDFNLVKQLVGKIGEFKGTLNSSAQRLLDGLRLSDDIGRLTEKLYVYARMRRDEDNANNHYQGMVERIDTLNVQVSSATSFLVPEIIAIPEETLRAWLGENKDLSLYRHFIEELLRQKAHVLSLAEERILAMSADIATASSNIFTMLNNADIKFPVIKDESGNDVELTKGRFGGFMESPDRRVRQDAFKALYSSYTKMKNSLGAMLGASVKKDIFYSQVRKYGSALEAALDQDNISVDVYNNLIKTVENHLPLLHRYLALRKRVLKLDELHVYDLYTPLVPEFKMNVPYEEAKCIVVQGLHPLGGDYVSQLQAGLEEGWIDVYENEGKTSGAYSWGAYDTKPYVLLNYEGKLNDVFTLAHELGHSLHSFYSNHTQPYVYSHYAIFLAEVASTVNESLLINHLLQNSKQPAEKMYLLNHYLEQFRGTLFRQTMFAEFEKIIHERVEQGEGLTTEYLCQAYKELNARYYGPEVVLDEEIAMEWARIPHFYSAFYVYKYATGFAAATALKEQILKEGTPAVERYMEFLKAGSSDYPLNILRKAGVDLKTPQPVEAALKHFGELLDELEKMLG